MNFQNIPDSITKRVSEACRLADDGFATKQAKKECMSLLGYAYEKLRDELHKPYLQMEEADRTDKQTEAYYDLPFSLAHVRQKHIDTYLSLFPEVAEQIRYLDFLANLRATYNGIEVQPKEKKEPTEVVTKRGFRIPYREVKKVLEEFEFSLASLDAEMIAKEIEEALLAYDRVEEVRAAGRGQDDAKSYLRRKIEAAGGKTMHDLFLGRSKPQVMEEVTRRMKAVIAARNYRLALKILEVAEGAQDIKAKYHQTRDGFNGFYYIEGNGKTWTVKIETILAGGHSIQRLHHRVLVKPN